MRRTPFALALASLAACSYVPPRFADAPPALVAGDNAPIRLPRPRLGFSPDTVANLHLRHALVSALEPARIPEAGDINAHDEVPASSWFRPDPPPSHDPAPALPFTVLPLEASGGAWPPALSPDHPEAALEGAVLIALDARGHRYVLRRDPPARPGLRTSAEAIAARLVRAVGYLTPEVHLLDIPASDLRPEPLARAFLDAGPHPQHGRYRLSAAPWPPLPAVDLGATLAIGTRLDDPNDRVPHEDRRTVRALGLLAGWLRLRNLDPEHLRDVYVGEPGPPARGHVQHHLIGLHGALGADLVGVPAEDGGALQRFFTLGLLPDRDPLSLQTRFPVLGEIDALVTKRDISPSPPSAPRDRALPGDLYWIAKRIARVPRAALADAVAAGRLGDPAAEAWLIDVLEQRRRQITAHAFARVTPLEVERLTPDTLVLRDLGVAEGHWTAEGSRYHLELLTSEGEPLAGHRLLRRPRVRLPPPERGAYLVVRLRVERGAPPLAGAPETPPPMEIHLIGQVGGAWSLRGIRH